MKRDLDLCRQLLLDIERQGADCSLSTLRSSTAPDADERIRYHLQMLIDAGFAKEVDRTNTGIRCVRLTNSGQEFIELVRNEAGWREAKWLVQELTGGQSWTVLRALLTKWAIEKVTTGERYRRLRRFQRPNYVPYDLYRHEPRCEPSYWGNSYRFDGLPQFDDSDDVRLTRPRPDYPERSDFSVPSWERDSQSPQENGYVETPIGVTIPVSLI